MKVIVLMRHAHAEDVLAGNSDKMRPLSSRGVKAATEVGKWCHNSQLTIELVVHSAARRTTDTAKIVAEQLAKEPMVMAFDELYNASPEIITDTIRCLPDEYSSALLVAHNPGISYLASLFTNGEVTSMTPATAVVIECDIEQWSDLSGSVVRLCDKIAP